MEIVQSESRRRELVFEGRSVSLATPDETDFILAADWMRASSKSAALSGDVHEAVTPDLLREADRSGKATFLAVVTGAGETIGMVNHRSAGVPGNYAIGGAIGPPELWSRGFGADAFGLLIYLLFGELGAWRVQISAGLHNRQMIQMLSVSRMFVLEGVHRDALLIDGRRYDSTVWSMLRAEFEEFYDEKVRGEEGAPSPFPLIPPEDAQAAALLFRRHLATDPVTSFSAYTDGPGGPRPRTEG